MISAWIPRLVARLGVRDASCAFGFRRLSYWLAPPWWCQLCLGTGIIRMVIQIRQESGSPSSTVWHAKRLPTAATAVHLNFQKSTWDRGGCDGGARGWSRMEVDAAFRTTREVESQIDAAMVRLNWRSVPVPGGDAVREYKPADGNTSGREYDGYAWVFSSPDGDNTAWILEVTAAPAEIETHAC